MRSAAKRKLNNAWLDYAEGRTDVRPPVTFKVESFWAAEYGIVDPIHGFTGDESGRDRARARKKGKKRGQEPEQFKRAREDTAEMRGAKNRLRYEQGPIEEGERLFSTDPSDPSNPRGYTELARAGLERVLNVALNKNADLSTFLHESGHVFLEVLGDLADRPDAPEQVQKDFAQLLSWFGVKERGDIQREHHEKFARGFEAYLMEGKAPTPKLAAMFERFRLWLRQVYRDLTSLNVELTDEVRGVFDRMLATEEEIQRTQDAMGLKLLWSSPEEAGMSPDQWQAYLEDARKALSTATRQAELRVFKDRLRVLEGWWKAEEKKEREEAGKAYDELPTTRARQFLRNGDFVFDAGDGLVSKGPVRKLDPERVAYALGRQPGPALGQFLKAGGMDPDAIADLFGYSTGRELLEALEQHPERDAWVARRAAERMAEQHPDILAQREAMRELTAKGLHGDFTASWLQREWDSLRVKAGFDPETGKYVTKKGTTDKLPPIEAIQRAARLLAERREVRRLDAGAALKAERAAAEKAQKAAVAGNFGEAAVYKQQQLLNMFLHRELSEAREARDKFLRLAATLKGDDSRARLGKASPIYRDGMDALLEAFGVMEPLEREEPLPSLGEVVQQMMGDGATVLFDEELLGKLLAGERTWKELTVAELRELDAALRNIQGAARTKATVLMDGKRQDKQDVVDQLLVEAAQNVPETHALPSTESAATLGQRIGGLWNKFDGSLLQPATMLRWLGGRDTGSAWFRAVLKPLQDAKAREVDLLNRTIRPILEAFEQMPATMRAHLTDSIDGKKLFPNHRVESGQNLAAPTRRFELLMIALNAGNESNLERLLIGRSITPEQLKVALDELTKEEMDWVQAVWDAAESLWPEAAALEERQSGLAPPKIERKPLATRHGTYAGGYFPAVYDRRVEPVGELQVGEQVAALMDPSYTRPGTARSHLKKRVEGFTGVLALEPSAVLSHLVQVAHDLAYREAVQSVGGLIMDRRIQATLKERLGDGRARTFLQWVKDVGQMRGQEGLAHAGVVLKAARTLRANNVIAALGFSAVNAIEDMSNLVAAIPRTDLKARHLAAALAEFARAPMEASALAHEKSGELRTRRGQLQRELARGIKKMTEKGPLSRGPLEWLRHHAFAFMEASDWATSTPIWLGAYRQALANANGLSEEQAEKQAVVKADDTIRQVFPSHSPVDQAAILRDKGWVGTSLTFYGFLNVYYNGLRDLSRMFGEASGVAGKGAVMGQMLAYIAAVSVFSDFLRGRGREDDEDWAQWFLRKSVLGPLSALPWGGDIANAIDARLLGKQTNNRQTSLVGTAVQLGEAVLSLPDEDTELSKRLTKLLRAVAPVVGIPASQPIRTGTYLERALSGEAEPRGPFDAVGGAIYGEREGQPDNPATLLQDAISGER